MILSSGGTITSNPFAFAQNITLFTLPFVAVVSYAVAFVLGLVKAVE